MVSPKREGITQVRNTPTLLIIPTITLLACQINNGPIQLMFYLYSTTFVSSSTCKRKTSRDQNSPRFFLGANWSCGSSQTNHRFHKTIPIPIKFSQSGSWTNKQKEIVQKHRFFHCTHMCTPKSLSFGTPTAQQVFSSKPE